MYYFLKSRSDIDIFYHTFSDGTGGLIAFPHSDHHHVPMSDYCPPDTKVYAILDGDIAYEVWPRDKEKQYRAKWRRLHGYWRSTCDRYFIAKSESEPDFAYE